MNEQDATIRDLQQSLERSNEQRDQLAHAIYKIKMAIVEEGKMPDYHKTVMARHRLEWGTLHNAIDYAIEVLDGKK